MKYASIDQIELSLLFYVRLSACFAVVLSTLVPHLAAAGEYALPPAGQGLVGAVRERTLEAEDTFALVARQEGVGYEALRRINPDVDEWLPAPGSRIVLPTRMLLPAGPREGVVINLSELRLYWYDRASERVFVYPIGIGSEGRETPVMNTRVVSKISQPTWYPPASVRADHAARGDILPGQVPPGPDNPLGEYAIKLSRPGYFVHGTNQPIGVGRRVSAGCIRLYADDIAALVQQVPNGTPVKVIKQPFKVAWHEDGLYLEAHASEQASDWTEVVRQVVRATRERQVDVNWDQALAAARAGTGLPVKISAEPVQLSSRNR